MLSAMNDKIFDSPVAPYTPYVVAAEVPDMGVQPDPPGPTGPMRTPNRPTMASFLASRGSRGVTDGMEAELVAKLESTSLIGLRKALAKARVLSLAAFMDHTVPELDEALTGHGGVKSGLSLFERRKLVEAGLTEPARAPAVAPRRAAEGNTRRGGAGPGLLSEDALAEDDGAAPEEDGDDADIDEAPEEDVRSEVSQSEATGRAYRRASLLTGAEYAGALLGGVPIAEITLPAVAKLVRLIHSRLSTPIMEEPGEIEEAIDMLDVGLAQGVKTGLWKLSQLQAAIPTMRAATRVTLELASTMATPQPTTAPLPAFSEAQALASSILEAQANGRLSNKDQELAEEISATKARLDAVADDSEALDRLDALKKFFESSASEADKMRFYGEIVSRDLKVEKLLKSAYLRDPTGVARPQVLQGVKGYRAVKMGMLAAARTLLRDSLPANASSDKFIEAAYWGRLGATKDGSAFNVDALANPDKPKPWLGVAAEKNEKAKSKEAQLVTLLTALPPISLALHLLHPTDATIPLTMAAVSCEMSKGLKVASVSVAVEGVLAPLLRSYEEAWDQFQKSPSAPLPSFGEIWEAEKKRSTFTRFMAATAALAHAPSPAAAPADGDNGKSLKEIESKIKGLASTLNRVQTMMSGDEDDEGGQRRGGRGRGGKGDRKKTPAAAPAPSDAPAPAKKE